MECQFPHAVMLTKVKAHTTAQDVDSGVTTCLHHVGNKLADETADLGTDSYMHHTKDIVETLERRHRSYAKFMMQVHDMLIAVYAADKEARERVRPRRW